MPEPLRPLGRPRLYEQVLHRLREYVTANGLGKGDKLPTERDLAERLQVSRASVKQAVVVLEVQGLVDVRQGGGIFLRADTLDGEPVTELVERRRRLPDVLEAREALETKLAELAAERRTEEDLRRIDAALELMAELVEHGGEVDEGDRRFHEAIAAAARSALLAEFMGAISGQVAESRRESLRQPGRPSRSLAQHRAIADAIRAGDPRAASAAMRRHLKTVARVRLLDWTPED
ncbi:FadR family transcriptional regulator [Allokutzneria sp. A3M-2-11 16]|uniref:FadR/GntR family transcriptional regulator n=1 Tax=Allokutzneria sp. A3M-2-11 16 TaxID=2962043 RepID=UPI0020B77B1A|nr:FadR/GntR family transcriptional regulator [Allokutzneria sp. A3M-2-11 16]MCP3803012.1 FadR family transcriptional regulator [Allokutzneria sp. A3M-2-11 16]